MLQCRNQLARNFRYRRHMHCGGEGVVGRLAHVHVVVGVHQRFFAARAAQHFVGAIGDDLVGIHVGLGARPGLPNHQGKFVVQFSFGDFGGRCDDGVGDFPVQGPRSFADGGCRLFNQAQGADHRGRHAIVADAKILQGSLSLSAPISIGGDFDGPEGVLFRARFVGQSECRLPTFSGRYQARRPCPWWALGQNYCPRGRHRLPPLCRVRSRLTLWPSHRHPRFRFCRSRRHGPV